MNSFYEEVSSVCFALLAKCYAFWGLFFFSFFFFVRENTFWYLVPYIVQVDFIISLLFREHCRISSKLGQI